MHRQIHHVRRRVGQRVHQQVRLRAKNHIQVRHRAAEAAIQEDRRAHRKVLLLQEVTVASQAVVLRTRQARRTIRLDQAAVLRTRQVRIAHLGRVAVLRIARRTDLHVVALLTVRLQEDSLIKSFMYICKK